MNDRDQITTGANPPAKPRKWIRPITTHLPQLTTPQVKHSHGFMFVLHTAMTKTVAWGHSSWTTSGKETTNCGFICGFSTKSSTHSHLKVKCTSMKTFFKAPVCKFLLKLKSFDKTRRQVRWQQSNFFELRYQLKICDKQWNMYTTTPDESSAAPKIFRENFDNSKPEQLHSVGGFPKVVIWMASTRWGHSSMRMVSVTWRGWGGLKLSWICRNDQVASSIDLWRKCWWPLLPCQWLTSCRVK